jgi:two-component system, sensor histidine kinase and response regulator
MAETVITAENGVATACSLPACRAYWEALVKKHEARQRQLHGEILSRREENEVMVAENLRQNEALRELNAELDGKVQARTCELLASKEALQAQNQKMAELGQAKEALMHMVVHDMKNPLTAVMGTLGLCRGNRVQVAPEIKELLVGAHVQSVKLLCMVDEILTISRMQSKEFEVHPEPMDMVSLVQQSMSMMSLTTGGKKVTFRFEPTLSELWVSGDYPTIERTLNNLLNNAIKYAPADSEILLEVTPQGDRARLGVTNWGDPIPPESQDKIFDQFYRVKADVAKYAGTGLGLTFCRLAIQAHGGTIGVESPVPPHANGACFFFTLPLAAEPAPGTPE